MKTTIKCPNCGNQHHVSFPYCEHCGATWELNLSDVVLDNKQFKTLQKIGDVKCTCTCGWIGRVDDCEPDVDSDGSLGCPKCLKVVTHE